MSVLTNEDHKNRFCLAFHVKSVPKLDNLSSLDDM